MQTYNLTGDLTNHYVHRILSVLKDRIEARWNTAVTFAENGTLELALDESLVGGCIEKTDNGYRLTGGDVLALWNVAGILLRSAPAGGEFRPAPVCKTYVTNKKFCGIYFATHFFNYYHVAPLDELRHYVEDLALWGMQSLTAWFDMHHYSGADDPEGIAFAKRLNDVFAIVKDLGLKIQLGNLANEGFADTTDDIRATNAVQNGYVKKPIGFYHTEICPSKPGGTEKILENLDALCRLFKDNPPDYFRIWPYDQGGCTCEKCAPWGSNGYLKLCRLEAEKLKEHFPNIKIALSTWYFDTFYKDDTEWYGILEADQKGELDYADFIYADFPKEFPRFPLEHRFKTPIVSFNEISMFGASPWGGYGANPMPEHILEQWNDAGKSIDGGDPYSEGYFEDINKAITLRLFQEGADPRQTVREYLRYECSVPEHLLDEGVDMIYKMEKANYKDAYTFQLKEERSVIWDTTCTAEVLATAQKINDALTEDAKNGLKWRQIYLRSVIDNELTLHDGYYSDKFFDCTEELDRLYHTGRSASRAIRPYTRDQIELLREYMAQQVNWKGAKVFWWEDEETQDGEERDGEF